MFRTVRELIRQEAGQDLVEYALLAMFLVLTIVAVWQAIAAAIGLNYGGYDTGVQDLWEPPDPPPSS